MHAMMQTRMRKVEKFLVFFIPKLGLLQPEDAPPEEDRRQASQESGGAGRDDRGP